MKSANLLPTPQEIKTIIIETAYMRDGFKILAAEAAVKEAINRREYSIVF
jgi:hypothetical protein